MNILIPDSELRKFLKTKATPQQIKDCLSLCGPSVERIYTESGEPVYDVEITTNRPDAMSVYGVAREASVIIPRFGIPASLIHKPMSKKLRYKTVAKSDAILKILTDPTLNPRWTSVVLQNVNVKQSPKWLKDFLIKTGIRPINTVVDVTNYIMRVYGQPTHAFDYDTITNHCMKLRASHKDEQLITLDGKSHTLPGDDIVIEDGSGRLIDLCGIMGGQNSSITDKTTRVLLFTQTYDPTHIRKTSMALAHRTEAATLFEKSIDSEMTMPALLEGIQILQDIANARVMSPIYDIYHKPFVPYKVSASRQKLDNYLGTHISDKEVVAILSALGLSPKTTSQSITITVPSYRRDITIDVDIIEEIARIYGYHNIQNRLPDGEMPAVIIDPILKWEEEIKIRLRDWGYTEMITYSMISEKLMDIFEYNVKEAYKINNPLSSDWVYMRPHAIASLLPVFIQNINQQKNLKIFELTMSYVYQKGNLPKEQPVLNVLWAGDKFLEAKGLAERIFSLMGIDFQQTITNDDSNAAIRYTDHNIICGEYASLGILNPALLEKLGTHTQITRLYINIGKIVSEANPHRTYIPVPNHSASVEDLAFVVPKQFMIGPLITALKHADPLVSDVTLLDVHGDTRTLHITYLHPDKTLTSDEITPIRNKLLSIATSKFGVTLKS